MLKFCVICEAEFDARGLAKTCSPECRATMKRAYWSTYHRERKKVDPAHRRMKNKARMKWAKKKYHTDPEWREKQLERSRPVALARHYKLAATDPTYRPRMAETARRFRRRDMEEKAVAGIARVAAELESRAAT